MRSRSMKGPKARGVASFLRLFEPLLTDCAMYKCRLNILIPILLCLPTLCELSCSQLINVFSTIP